MGLSEGDNYTTMAKRIQKELIGPDGAGGSYYKAIRIARTEAHRVREEGNLDAAQNLTEKLEPAGITMVKIWHTMKDERVRPNRARKTKGGWKYTKGGKYDHQKMEGVQVPVNEEFTLPSGAKTQAPGKSGVAGEDINCRCFLSYDVVDTASVTKASRKHAIQDDNFETINNTKGDSIRPASLRKNLKKSKVGRETLQYIEEQNISIRLLYGADNPKNELGFYDGFDDQIVIFADSTKTTQKTAEIICHEVLHRRLGNNGILDEEIKCWEIELLHRNGFLTQQDKDRILKSVKELYPELQ